MSDAAHLIWISPFSSHLIAQASAGAHFAKLRGMQEKGTAPMKTTHEVEAWKAAGHTIFFLKAGWTNIEFWQQVQKLARCFPDIIEHARRAKHSS